MPKKIANEATIAPPPVSDASVPVFKKTREKKSVSSVPAKPVKPATSRRKAVAKSPETSISNLAGAVKSPGIFEPREIEERAYRSWIERGCPMGSPEEDWYRAERELIARFATTSK